MPSKKRKYNARFPAGRIKKIMQTDEEVGKVAQAVPIIISRTLELFVESLLTKAMHVTSSRNAKTLSPSHVKQCILAEARFDFLKDLVKNIPDVSAAEEKEMISAENSPNSTRFAEMCIPRRLGREDSNSSSSEQIEPKRQELDLSNNFTPSCSTNDVVDLTVKQELRPNFYKELNFTEESTKSVITINPTYTQPSTSAQIQITTQKCNLNKSNLDFYKKPFTEETLKSLSSPSTPITPMFNIDFTKIVPEIKVLDTNIDKVKEKKVTVSRQNSRSKVEPRVEVRPSPAIDLDNLNSANLEIDEDYDT